MFVIQTRMQWVIKLYCWSVYIISDHEDSKIFGYKERIVSKDPELILLRLVYFIPSMYQ